MEVGKNNITTNTKTLDNIEALVYCIGQTGNRNRDFTDGDTIEPVYKLLDGFNVVRLFPFRVRPSPTGTKSGILQAEYPGSKNG